MIVKWLSIPAGQPDDMLKQQIENLVGTQPKKIFLKDSIASVLQGKKKLKNIELLHGEQKSFYPSGSIIKSVKNFEYGRLKGAQQFFHQNGIKAREYTVFYGDTVEGKEWDWGGRLLLERTPLPNGYTCTFYKNGTKESVFQYDKTGKFLSGPAYEYYPDGTLKCEKNYTSGVLDGLYKYFFPDGTPDSVLNFKDSVLNGEGFKFHKNGKIKEKFNYSFGQLQGTYIYYYTNEKEEYVMNFIRGKKNGIEKKFLPGGFPVSETTFENDVENGPYKIYHKNVESVMEAGFYVNGYKHGDVDFFSIDGKKVATVKYNYGKRITEANY
ncbi:MAG: hypothetical protein A3H98_00345 [Bacteroidetes bacterium RIFCSPLOWO2_02_FULL_36_8]|nr:MAG: hypothetical protein A3H98_00345 [Bacteroidetes bacterium RIFCSPLOWO2_02_FULL_36_8]